MNVTFAALNLIAIAVVVVVVGLPRLREHRRAQAEVPRSIRPHRQGQELTQVVTEWAKATGVLTSEGSANPSHDHADQAGLTDENV